MSKTFEAVLDSTLMDVAFDMIHKEDTTAKRKKQRQAILAAHHAELEGMLRRVKALSPGNSVENPTLKLVDQELAKLKKGRS